MLEFYNSSVQFGVSFDCICTWFDLLLQKDFLRLFCPTKQFKTLVCVSLYMWKYVSICFGMSVYENDVFPSMKFKKWLCVSMGESILVCENMFILVKICLYM